MPPFAKRASDRVSSIGEEKLILRIRGWLGDVCPEPPAGIGDDCAVLRPNSRRALVTVDPVIFGRHFDAGVPASSVGEKLLKRNLSDIAAMGGTPDAAVVALVLDPRTSIAWLAGFYRGVAAAARRHGVAVVGGDVAEAPGVVSASLTLLGHASGSRVLTRTGAVVGDLIFATGELGRSLPTGHHFRFEPRLAEAAWLARQAGVRAMTDISDGLAKDVRSLNPPGGQPAIDPAAIPRRDGASLREALTDGEDYELLFAFSHRADILGFVRRWRRAFPDTALSCLGLFAPEGRLPEGAVNLGEFRGYEHLDQRARRKKSP